MANMDFKDAVVRLTFEAGQTEDGKIIKKLKSYRNVKSGASAQEIIDATNVLASFSEWPLLGTEKIETSNVTE